MTSIFRRALTSSVSRDEPGNSIANPESPKTLSVKASPSFNDFSLCAHDDAENEYTGVSQSLSPTSRSSLEVERQPPSPRFAYMFGQSSSPRQIPQKAAPMQSIQSQDQKGAQTLPRQPEGKIGGMSYHDYCDLIRSCSL